MTNYINEQLTIGAGFSRLAGNNYILSIWGILGSGDLQSFSTSEPTGDIASEQDVKLVAGSVTIV